MVLNAQSLPSYASWNVNRTMRLPDLAHLELGRAERSKTLLEAVIAAEPRNAFAYYLQEQIAYEGETFEAAVTRYETVLNLQPAATQIHALLGLAYHCERRVPRHRGSRT